MVEFTLLISSLQSYQFLALEATTADGSGGLQQYFAVQDPPNLLRRSGSRLLVCAKLAHQIKAMAAGDVVPVVHGPELSIFYGQPMGMHVVRRRDEQATGDSMHERHLLWRHLIGREVDDATDAVELRGQPLPENPCLHWTWAAALGAQVG